MYTILVPPRERYWVVTKSRSFSLIPTTKPAQTLAAENNHVMLPFGGGDRGISHDRCVASGGIYGE